MGNVKCQTSKLISASLTNTELTYYIAAPTLLQLYGAVEKQMMSFQRPLHKLSEKADDGARGREERRGMDGRCDRRYDCRRAIAGARKWTAHRILPFVTPAGLDRPLALARSRQAPKF